MPFLHLTKLPTECLWHNLPGTPSHLTKYPGKHWPHCSSTDPQNQSRKPQTRTTTESSHYDPRSAHANDARHPPWVQIQCGHSPCSESQEACQIASHQRASLETVAHPEQAKTERCCTPPEIPRHNGQHRRRCCWMDLAS